jgi:hypothetical protein
MDLLLVALLQIISLWNDDVRIIQCKSEGGDVLLVYRTFWHQTGTYRFATLNGQILWLDIRAYYKLSKLIFLWMTKQIMLLER